MYQSIRNIALPPPQAFDFEPSGSREFDIMNRFSSLNIVDYFDINVDYIINLKC
jgi:hypothetical protein